MKTVIKLKSGIITKEEVLENIKVNDGVCYLELSCDWDDASYDHLNFLIDDEVENGNYLCDVAYKPIKLNDDGTITFECCAADTAEYLICSEEL